MLCLFRLLGVLSREEIHVECLGDHAFMIA